MTQTAAAETSHQQMNIAPSSTSVLFVLSSSSVNLEWTDVSGHPSTRCLPCHIEPAPRGYKRTVSSTEHIHEASCRARIRDAGRPLWVLHQRPSARGRARRLHEACVKHEHPRRRWTTAESLSIIVQHRKVCYIIYGVYVQVLMFVQFDVRRLVPMKI